MLGIMSSAIYKKLNNQLFFQSYLFTSKRFRFHFLHVVHITPWGVTSMFFSFLFPFSVCISTKNK